MAEVNAQVRSAGPPRVVGLDVLRSIAISWVMVYHALDLDIIQHGNWVVNFGWMGVDLFFVLSGYLIAGQLFKPYLTGERPNLRRFFGRRFLRTIPAFAIITLLYFSFPRLREWPDIQPIWQFITFTENLFFEPPAKSFSHVWSLCVEEQFYLVFPSIVIILAIRPSTLKVIMVAGAIIMFGMVCRGYFWMHNAAPYPLSLMGRPKVIPYMKLIYYPTWSRLDGLLFGVLLAATKYFKPRVWRKVIEVPNIFLLIGILGLAASMLFFQGQFPGFAAAVLGYPLLAASFSLLVVAAHGPRSLLAKCSYKWIGFLAKGSYSLYLSHKIVFHLVRLAAVDAPVFVRYALLFWALVAAVAAGSALYFGVERPFLILRDRLDRQSVLR